MPEVSQDVATINNDYQYGFSKRDTSTYKTKQGLSRDVVIEISQMKGEPDWMLQKRLQAFELFESKPMPQWGGNLNDINFDEITYFNRPADQPASNWDELPEEILDTYNKIGIPQAEQKYLAGVGAQYDSEVVYHSLKKQWEEQGVIFLDTDTALKEHPEFFEEYFGKLIPAADNKFAALNTAVWSGGSFVYVPKGVHLDIPLQAYFRINVAQSGQFERTLIIADEGSFVHYVEGCTAPVYAKDSLHAAVVEIVVKKGARVRYTTIQNWSKNVYNLVTKRAFAYEDATMEWVDGNLGSKLTMKYPSIYLMEPGAKGDILSLAFANKDQHQDAGGKVIHLAPNTTSSVTSKSLSKNGGRSSYRGLVHIPKGSAGSKCIVRCDALLLDGDSRSDTYPTMKIHESDVSIAHEATVSKIGEEQLFYLMSRGIPQDEAEALIVNGFVEPIVKELPLEYAVEMNRLIQMEMEGSVG